MSDVDVDSESGPSVVRAGACPSVIGNRQVDAVCERCVSAKALHNGCALTQLRTVPSNRNRHRTDVIARSRFERAGARRASKDDAQSDPIRPA